MQSENEFEASCSPAPHSSGSCVSAEPATASQQSGTRIYPAQHNEGQRIFEQNCSRCHTPPDGFSPRISGTIVRHMRMRASLSKHEEQELLHYFNP